MKSFLTFLISELVDNPDKLVIEEKETEFGYTDIIVSVLKEDMGKIIGKNGKIIKATRTLLRVLGLKQGKRFNLQLKEIL